MNVCAFALVTVALVGTSSRSGCLTGEARAYGASAASLLPDDLVVEDDALEDEFVDERQLLRQPTSSPSTSANAPAGLCVCSPAAAATTTTADDAETKIDVAPAAAPRTDVADSATPHETAFQELRDWLQGGGPAAVVAAAAAAARKAKTDSAPSRVAPSPSPVVDSAIGRRADFNDTPPAAGAELLQGPPPNVTSSTGCPHGFFSLRDWDHCYLLSTFKTTQALASEYCYAMGGDVELLTINSTREHYLVTYLIQQTAASKDADDWWTSGYARDHSGWVWKLRVRRPEMRFKLWSLSATTYSDGGARCIILQKSSNYFWSSDKCSDDARASTGQPRHNFICKAPATKPKPCY